MNIVHTCTCTWRSTCSLSVIQYTFNLCHCSLSGEISCYFSHNSVACVPRFGLLWLSLQSRQWFTLHSQVLRLPMTSMTRLKATKAWFIHNRMYCIFFVPPCPEADSRKWVPGSSRHVHPGTFLQYSDRDRQLPSGKSPMWSRDLSQHPDWLQPEMKDSGLSR